MNPLEKPVVKDVLQELGSRPMRFMELQAALCGDGGHPVREVDKALQVLRKAGKARYLTKAEGGPGWAKGGS